MKKISTGEPSTLGTYRNIAHIMNGGDEESEGVKFIDKKIAEQGVDMEVIADESQMIYLLGSMLVKEVTRNDNR